MEYPKNQCLPLNYAFIMEFFLRIFYIVKSVENFLETLNLPKNYVRFYEKAFRMVFLNYLVLYNVSRPYFEISILENLHHHLATISPISPMAVTIDMTPSIEFFTILI